MDMPFYDLKCTKCGKEFNIMASMSQREKKLIKCPNCGNNELDPIFTNVNIVQTRKSEPMACPNFERCGGSCPHG
jgi:putative FmdB family regulatory protein